MSWWQHLQPPVWNNHSHTGFVWRLETRLYEEKRNWKYDVNCDRRRQIFLVLYDIETKAHCCFSTFTERLRYKFIFAITINIWICTILSCSQNKSLRNYVLDKWLTFVKFWKMYCTSWSTFAKRIGLLVLMTRIWKIYLNWDVSETKTLEEHFILLIFFAPQLHICYGSVVPMCVYHKYLFHQMYMKMMTEKCGWNAFFVDMP